jgi:hypothetical protein
MGEYLAPLRIAPSLGEVLNEFWEFAAVSLTAVGPDASGTEA